MSTGGLCWRIGLDWSGPTVSHFLAGWGIHALRRSVHAGESHARAYKTQLELRDRHVTACRRRPCTWPGEIGTKHAWFLRGITRYVLENGHARWSSASNLLLACSCGASVL